MDLNEGLHEVIVRLMANREPGAENQEQRLITTTDWSGLDIESCFGNGQSILDLLFEYGPETIMKL